MNTTKIEWEQDLKGMLIALERAYKDNKVTALYWLDKIKSIHERELASALTKQKKEIRDEISRVPYSKQERAIYVGAYRESILSLPILKEERGEG